MRPKPAQHSTSQGKRIFKVCWDSFWSFINLSPLGNHLWKEGVAIKKYPILLLIAIGLTATLTWRFAPRSPARIYDQNAKLELVADKHFFNEEVVLDGKDFQECRFTNVTFFYKGSLCSMSHCTIEGDFFIRLGDPRFENVVGLIKGLGLMKAPILDMNGHPITGLGEHNIYDATTPPSPTPSMRASPP